MCLIMLWALPGNAHANDGAPQQPSIYIEVETLSFARPFWAALTLPIADGETIVFDNEFIEGMVWRLPNGFSLGEVLYPLPQAANWGDESAKYSQSATILFELIPPPAYEQSNIASALPYSFLLHASWQTCVEACKDQTENFVFELFSGSGEIDSAQQQVFYNARELSLPPLPWSVSISIEPKFYTLEVILPDNPLSLGEPVFIPIEKGFNGQIASQSKITDGVLTLKGEQAEGMAQLDHPYFRTLSGILAFKNDGNLTSGYRVFANNLQDEVIVWQTRDTGFKPQLSFIMALLLAFIGGLILNLMPCVFPVLAMKAFHLASASDKSQADMRQDGIAYTLGILVSFLIVATILIAVRSMGGVVGWGFQLQSPIFVLMLIWVMSAVVLNFIGGFEFKFGAIQNIGQSGALAKLFGGGERVTAFSTGVLATVVATPCTAPFMAPAIGFALVQPPINSLLIFMSLGFGLAFPYLVISFVPAFGRLLPKPGLWMVRLRNWLALPLGLTVLWLFWVLAKQVSQAGFLFALASFALFVVGLVFWQNDRFKKLKKIGLISILLGCGLVLMIGDKSQQKGSEVILPGIVEGLETIVWSPQLVDVYRGEGRPVFLNVTAAWCITCLVHEKLVFENDSFQAYLKANNIAYMVADWTNADARIANLLAQYDRSGIPFYIYYPAGSERPAVLLPEILTPASTIRLLENNR